MRQETVFFDSTLSRLRSLVVLLVMCLQFPAIADDIQGNAKDPVPTLAMRISKDDEIIINGAHPDGKILIVGYERSGARYKVIFHRHRAYLTADAKGSITWKPKGGIGPDSTWVGVDVQSGRYGAVAPGSSPARQKTLPPNAIKRETNGKSRRLEAALPMVYVVVVRPGEGAWEASAGDGGRQDHDSKFNGKTEVSVEDFRSVADDRPIPDQFGKDDLLLVFSPEQAMFFALKAEEQ